MVDLKDWHIVRGGLGWREAIFDLSNPKCVKCGADSESASEIFCPACKKEVLGRSTSENTTKEEKE